MMVSEEAADHSRDQRETNMTEAKRRHPNIVNLAEIEPQQHEKGARFGYAMRWLGMGTGARGIGCSWIEVPPGRTAFPMHFHSANEEALFVLDGEGTLWIGKETVPLREGDYVTFPPGEEHAHQLVNTGKTPLRYLALSTLQTTEVVGYPESGKIGAASFAFDASGKRVVKFRALFPRSAQVTDYYDGEKLD
jgi:uncharacterized cupin superfamily protein